MSENIPWTAEEVAKMETNGNYLINPEETMSREFEILEIDRDNNTGKGILNILGIETEYRYKGEYEDKDGFTFDLWEKIIP